MAESKRRIRKVSGAVLMMVVTIMFILVIMLLATLTVVSNTNKRTIAKFEENQAYYTARSVQEVYVDEVLENTKKVTGKKDAIAKAWTDSGFCFDVPDPTDPSSKNPYMVNLENNQDFAGADICEGFVTQQQIFSILKPKYILITDSNMGNGKTYGADDIIIDESGKFKEGKGYKNNKYWIENKDADYYIEYEAKLPDVSNLIDNGRLVGTLDSDGVVNVRVELLKLAYQTTEGTLLYDGKYKFSDKESSLTDPEANLCESGKMKISKVDMGNLYYSIKVSATSKVANATGGFSERTVAVMLEPGITPPLPGSPGRGAVSASSGSVNDDNIAVYGGFYSNSPDPNKSFEPKNNNSFVGNSVFTGYKRVKTNVNLDNWMLSKNEYFVVPDGYYLQKNNNQFLVGRGKLDLSGKTDDEKRIEQGKRPFIYAKGIALAGNGVCIGTNNRSGTDNGALDCVCDVIAVANPDMQNDGEVEWGDFSSGTINRDNAALVIGVQNTNQINGNIYVDGDIFIAKANNAGNMTINGDVYCTGSIYACYDLTKDNNALAILNGIFKGKVYAAGGVYNSSGAAISIDAADVDPGDFGSWATEKGADCKFNLDYVLANRESSDKDGYQLPYLRNVELHLPYDYQSNMNINGDGSDMIIKKFSIMPGDDQYGKYDVTSGTYIYYEPVDALRKVSGTDQEPTESKKPKLTVKSGTPIQNCKVSSKSLNIGGANVSLSNVIVPPGASDTGLAEMSLSVATGTNSLSSGTYFIDATGDNCIQIELSGNDTNLELTFVVCGDKAVYFTIPKEKGNLFGVKNFQVMSYEVYNAKNNNDIFYLGYNYDDEHQMTPDQGPSFPLIFMFVDRGVEYYNQNFNGIYTGIIDAPFSEVHYGGNHGPSINYDYDLYADSWGLSKGQLKAPEVQFGGSLIVDKLNTGNKFDIIKFRDDAKSDSGEGKTSMITWKRQRYLSRK